MKTTELPVNAQQGLIMLEDGGQVVALYHHHQKTVVILIPWSEKDITLSSEFKDYNKLKGATDSVSLSVWDNATQGDTHLSDFILKHK